jgi:RND family efflux transporter MFP subunit
MLMPPSETLTRLMAATLLAVAAMACGHEARPTASGGAAPAARTVATVPVERSGGGSVVAVPATVQARQRAALAARIPASIVELPLREGDAVATGSVVARLDDTALRSALAAAEAAAKTADVDLARVESRLAQGAATPKEAEEARARAAGTAAAVAAAKDSLAYAVLRSPFDGLVAARPGNVGDVVSPGTTVVEIEGRGGLEVRATVEAGLVSQLHAGSTLDAQVDGQPSALTATVRAVSASADPATHRFEIRADLPAASGLRSGLFARLFLPSPNGAPRLLVPATAVFQRGGLNGLFVVKEGTARLRWIATGPTVGANLEVRAGVDSGERVAVDPANLVDGQPVTEAAPEPR